MPPSLPAVTRAYHKSPHAPILPPVRLPNESCASQQGRLHKPRPTRENVQKDGKDSPGGSCAAATRTWKTTGVARKPRQPTPSTPLFFSPSFRSLCSSSVTLLSPRNFATRSRMQSDPRPPVELRSKLSFAQAPVLLPPSRESLLIRAVREPFTLLCKILLFAFAFVRADWLSLGDCPAALLLEAFRGALHASVDHQSIHSLYLSTRVYST